ncbi:3-mercaptopyruvate sulfurtransferase [hydrothermal vent metagenome]|uniref:3-mercaptopyruvate sulfurtransferase n=1 Tax=hydrothermal vent metagenome TaxID=652676 RepID=A0A3B0S176_9ZZZZ
MGSPIVSTDWLHEHLEAPDIVIIHAMLAFEKTLDELKTEYLETRIPGALPFDIDEIADQSAPLAHTMPSAVQFSSQMRKMGVGDGQRIVVYDTSGNFCASRVWWMFRTFGIEDVVVLDGGLPKWMAEEKPMASGEPRPFRDRHFTARVQSMNVRDMDDVRQALANGDDQVVDARSPDRFTGKEKETREGIRSGRMPGALNVYYKDLLHEDQTMKSADEMRKIFEAAGVDLKKPIITSCGSGVTAAILSLGFEIAGYRGAAVYDGSWTEWGGCKDNEVITGPVT